MVDFTIRAAQEADVAIIRKLIHEAGINPTGLDWKRFIIAQESNGNMLGCGQLKTHGQGILELASLAVVPEYRGKGIASALIMHLLASGSRPIYLMCRSGLGSFYEKFGFQRMMPDEMPRYFRRMTQLAGLAFVLARNDETLLIMKLK